MLSSQQTKYSNINEELEYRYNLSRFESLGIDITLSSKFMIHKNYRSISNMYTILREVFEYSLSCDLRLNIIDCSPNLVTFYERLGYRRYHKNFIDPVLGEKVPLVLFVEDVEHYKDSNRFLYEICKKNRIEAKNYSYWFEERVPSYAI